MFVRIPFLRRRISGAALASLCLLACGASAASACSTHFEQRNRAAPLRRGYNLAFFRRHNPEYETSAAIHIAHAEQHDVLLLDDLELAGSTDARYASRWGRVLFDPPRIEPEMMSYGQTTGQAAFLLYRAIDWTHVHHEQTYDILSDRDVPWSKKERVTKRAVDYYLSTQHGAARSPAPLDVTMRRAAVMMKPYFGVYRTQYPRSTRFFYAAHWWHPVIYEAMMIAGNGPGQDVSVEAAQRLVATVWTEPPTRMLLSREVMPRYARMSPESANIFDNLHMLHGIAYAILSYEGWSIDEQRAELYRVIDAMSEKPGDRQLARVFEIPYPDMDPRRYEPWMKGYEGAMNRIMEEMLAEMWPMMSPDGAPEVPPAVMEQLRKKLRPGLEAGEHPGSLHQALMKLVPQMKMGPAAVEGNKPGKVHGQMVEMMLAHWRETTRGMPPAAPWPMDREPSLPALVSAGRNANAGGAP